MAGPEWLGGADYFLLDFLICVRVKHVLRLASMRVCFVNRKLLWWLEGGAKGDIRPGRHCAGGGIWMGKNMEF